MASGDDDERTRFQRAMAIVDKALDLPEDERAALVARECPEELRDDVHRLLAADASDDRRLSQPAGAQHPSALRPLQRVLSAGANAGRIVGPFRLISLLGKGGMGEVWIAERMGADFEQKLAVKLLYGGQGEASAARFRRERQILAKLAHPRIARMFDGGVTDDGQPWLAMEVVLGLPLVEHCVAKRLDVDARLRIFLEVCDAVQFAHRNLVVHRDLKPSNILVDEGGAPKLLDFGIAKLLEQEERTTSLTAVDERPMTPDYASPEQVRGETVTTASDVWTLGAILYEVLTDTKVDRSLLDTSRARPSAHVAEPRRKRSLEGDLDAIVLKAMRPEPKDRYGSVDALAADIRRHLDGSPVLARGEAAGYLLRSLLRRYRVAVGVASIVVAALAIGLVATLWQARRAEAEARKAERSEAFLIDMVRAFDPEKGDGTPLSQKDILERGEARLETSLAGQPVEQARLLRVFAETWLDIDDAARALRPDERALALQRSALGPRDIEVAKTLVVLGNVYEHRRQLDLAERASSEALSIAMPIEGPLGPTVGLATSQLGTIHCFRSEFAEGQRLMRQALEISQATHGAEATATLDRLSDLAVCLGDEGKFDESAVVNRRAVELSTKVRGPKHPATLLLRHNLASSLSMGGANCTEAEAILRDVVLLQRELFGTDDRVAGTKRMLGLAIDCQGRSQEALSLFEEAVRSYAVLEGPDSFMVGVSLLSRSQAERRLGRLADAEKTIREALRMHVARNPDDRFAARMRAALGATLADLGRFAEAREELVRALAHLEPRVPKMPYTRDARADLARVDAALAKPVPPSP